MKSCIKDKFSSEFQLIILICLINEFSRVKCSWDDWWTYDGISGPDFWGLLNPEWHLCNKGKRQSPINILPEELLFDANLNALNMDRHQLSGTLENNGHSIVFKVNQNLQSSQQSSIQNGNPNLNNPHSLVQQQLSSNGMVNGAQNHLKSNDFFSSIIGEQSANVFINNLQSNSIGLSDTLQFGNAINENNLHDLTITNNHLANSHLQLSSTDNYLNLWGGPLSYVYTLDSVHIHFGRTDELGSEHQIANHQFPAEIQVIAYNSDLYQNISEASAKSNGLTAISLLLQLGNTSNSELEMLINLAQNIKHRGENITIKSFSLYNLIPDISSYLTYDGSLTVPGCYETVTWIIINKSIFITRQQLYILRKLMQGESDSPKAPLGNNFRPIQSLNHRFIRTNIDFKQKDDSQCLSMKKNMRYQDMSGSLANSLCNLGIKNRAVLHDKLHSKQCITR